MSSSVWQIFLAIYSLLLTAIAFVFINTNSFSAFKMTKIQYKVHLIFLVALSALIAGTFLFDCLRDYRYRIAMLLICLSPIVLIHLTFIAKTKCMDKDNDEYHKIGSRSRLIDRIATSAYIIYIPLTLSYLQII